ncbi:MAG: hypothetical protein WED10_03430 [Brumimicrobium sp.]
MIAKTNVIKNGLLIFILTGLYFILLEALGMADNALLKFVNFIFVLIGVNNTLKYASKNGVDYLRKFISGVITVFIGVLLSAVALFIYLNAFETAEISSYAKTLIPAGTNFQYAAVVFVEGFVSSVVIVFIMLQYWKNENTPHDSSH